MRLERGVKVRSHRDSRADKEFEFHTMSNEKPLEAFQQGNDMI